MKELSDKNSALFYYAEAFAFDLCAAGEGYN